MYNESQLLAKNEYVEKKRMTGCYEKYQRVEPSKTMFKQRRECHRPGHRKIEDVNCNSNHSKVFDFFRAISIYNEHHGSKKQR